MDNELSATSGTDKLTLQFVCDDEMPVKLGDGTFGCVFRVQDSAHNNYALKIFYEPSDEFVLQSQNEEMDLGDRLRRLFKDRIERANEVERYLVVASHRVENFKSSPAYKKHADYFENLKFKVSNRGIVMDIYPLSLKDLLERGWPRTQEREANLALSVRKSGYSILRSLPQREREKCILPIMRQLADGLSILQEARCNHQDIKPANILIREVGPRIEAALADLGFVNTGQFQVAGSLFQMQPLGTRHYRSPEQVDFFDICEVDINPLENGDYELITRDPKFQDTFSEKGDLIVFSKLSEKVQWEIKDIQFEHMKDDSSVTRIVIEGLDGVKLHKDVRTQITVNKVQTDRTDIFGFGAIMLDMLTCGRSPEQFYNLLRVHDRATTIEKGLAQRYAHFCTGGGTVPEIDAIFQYMRVDFNSGFPHPDIVLMVLKCMMSKPSDSYYWKSGICGKWEPIKGDLDKIIRELNCASYGEVGSNYLTNGGQFRVEPRDDPQENPTQELSRIQSLRYRDSGECVERLVTGIRFLGKVAHMLNAEIRGGPDISYLVNVSPNSLVRRRGEFVPRFVYFENEDDFNAVMESGSPRSLPQLFAAGGLSPPFVRGLVQEGEVWVSENAGEGVHLGYELWYRGGRWPIGSLTDNHVLVDISATSKVSLVVGEHDSKKGTVQVTGDRVDQIPADTTRFHAHFVRKLDRRDYYVAMLGVYVRLIFFVDPVTRQRHTPQSIYFLEEGRGRVRLKRQGRPKRSMESLFSLMAGTYARLLTLQLDGSGERTNLIQASLDSFKDCISRLLRCTIDDLMDAPVDRLIETAKGNSRLIAGFPDIDRLVDENIVGVSKVA